jgi:tRNA pseudouridine55 synthase
MIGEKLGYPSHMSALVRIQSASFSLEDCFTFEQLGTLAEEGKIQSALAPLETGISYLPKYRINDTVAEKVKNGAQLDIPQQLADVSGPIVVETEDGIALAIYRKHPTKIDMMKPDKVLRNEQELSS